MVFLPTNSEGGLNSLILFFYIFFKIKFMALSIFAEKDFSRILNDVNGYGLVFLDRLESATGMTLYMIILSLMHFIVPNLSKFSTRA